MFKRRKLKIGDLVDESFKGSCVPKVYQVQVGTSKTIALSVEEIMAAVLATTRSYLMNMIKLRVAMGIKMLLMVTFYSG